MIRFAFIFSILLFSQSLFGQKQTTNDKQEIQNVLNTFMECLAKKDSTKFYSLFHNESVTWVGLFREKTQQAILKQNSKTPTHFTSTYKAFFRGISGFTSCEEKFYNVEIIEDGSIASVTFDYSFWGNKQKLNWGKESWGLVKINEQWKITSVIFSMEYESISPEPNTKK